MIDNGVSHLCCRSLADLVYRVCRSVSEKENQARKGEEETGPSNRSKTGESMIQLLADSLRLELHFEMSHLYYFVVFSLVFHFFVSFKSQ